MGSGDHNAQVDVMGGGEVGDGGGGKNPDAGDVYAGGRQTCGDSVV